MPDKYGFPTREDYERGTPVSPQREEPASGLDYLLELAKKTLREDVDSVYNTAKGVVKETGRQAIGAAEFLGKVSPSIQTMQGAFAREGHPVDLLAKLKAAREAIPPSESIPEKIGAGAAKVAPYLVLPTGGPTLAAKMATQAAGMGLVSAAQGGTLPETGVAAGIGAGFPVLGAAVKAAPEAVAWLKGVAPRLAEETGAIGPVVNASGESAASAEAMSRGAGMAARGEQFGIIDKGGNFRRLIGPEAVDIAPRPGELKVVMKPDGIVALDGDRSNLLRFNPAKWVKEMGGARYDLLHALGGGLPGAAIGATQGNTPGERLRNAAIGAGVGAAGNVLAGRALEALHAVPEVGAIEAAGAREAAGLTRPGIQEPGMWDTQLPRFGQSPRAIPGADRYMVNKPGLGEVIAKAEGKPLPEVTPGREWVPGSARAVEDDQRIAAALDRMPWRAPEDRAAVEMRLKVGNNFIEQRRMSRSWSQEDQAAHDIVINSFDFKPGTTLNAAETFAVRNGVAGLAARLRDVAQAGRQATELTAAGDEAGLKTLLDSQGVSSAGELFGKIAQASVDTTEGIRGLAGARSEAGRALRANAATGNAFSTPAGVAKAALDKGATAEQVAEIMGLQDPLAQFRYINSLSKLTGQDYYKWFYYGNLLSSPATHTRNFIGNTLSISYQTLSRFAAEKTIARGEMAQGETIAGVKGMVKTVPEAFRLAGQTLRRGYTDVAALHGQFPPPEPAGKLLQRLGMSEEHAKQVANFIPRAMQAGDVGFQAVAAAQEVYAAAFRAATREGKTGAEFLAKMEELIGNPTLETMKVASEMGKRAAFRQAPGPAVEALMTQAAKHPFIATTAMPFVKTPSNIIKRGWNIGAPGAGMISGGKLIKAGRVIEGRTQQMENIIGMFGMAVASALGYFGALRITGSDPSDVIRTSKGGQNFGAQTDKMYAEHGNPNSIEIFGQSIPYSQLAPFSLALALVGDFSDEAHRSGLSTKLLTTPAMNFARSLLGASYLSGPLATGAAVSEVASPAGGRPGTGVARIAGRTAQSLIPGSAFVRSVRQVGDPFVRSNRTDLLGSIEDNIRNILPGVSSSLPARSDYAGEWVRRPWGMAGRALQQSIFPFDVRPVKKDDVRSELAALANSAAARGERSPYLSAPSGKIKGTEPTPIQEADIARFVSERQYRALEVLMAKKVFRNATDPIRSRMVMQEMEQSRTGARAEASNPRLHPELKRTGTTERP